MAASALRLLRRNRMEEALRFFKTYEIWIYLLLSVGGVVYLRMFIQAWGELRGAVFGLERDQAQARLNRAASALILLIMISAAEFFLVSFVTPMVPGASPLPTPTLNPLATNAPEAAPAEEGGPLDAPTAAPLPTIALDSGNCVPGEIFILEPESGAVVRGEVEISGTANTPDFGFYKLEIARRQEPLWLTIQAGREVVEEGVLVSSWDTSRLPPGDYVLQLVVVNSQGEEMAPCRVEIRIEAPE